MMVTWCWWASWVIIGRLRLGVPHLATNREATLEIRSDGPLDDSCENSLPFVLMSQALSQTEIPVHPPDLAEAVRERGWLHLRATGTQNNLAAEALKLALQLGDPMAGREGGPIETLAPLPIENANINSLSMQHGLGAFPLHIDGAHLPQPPRFILLACARPGLSPIPTVLARFRDLRLHHAERHQCESAAVLIRNGRQSFYSTILDRSRPFIRFDQGCIKPMCLDGKQALKAIALRAAETGPTAFDWQAGDILVIDNWRVLHGRGMPPSIASPDRCILRMSIQ